MNRKAAMIALAWMALPPAAAAMDDAGSAPPLTVAVLAHPDDELFMAPALAALARQGHKVRIVHATPGDAGPGLSGLPKGEKLAAVRKEEAQCAGRALGADDVVNLGFGDGKLADHMRDGTLSQALARHIDPAYMVLTWGPDGGYGHADHRLVSAIATQIVQVQSEDDRTQLLYVGIPEGRLPPVPDMAGWAQTSPSLLHTAIEYTPADLAAAKAAAMCHATQFDEASRQGMMALFDATMWRGQVHFRPAF